MAAVSLSVELGKLELANPVMNASGTFGCGAGFEDLVDVSRLGALIAKTVTLEPREGNAPPRMCETASGIVNAIGLENPGVEAFLAEELPRMKAYGVPVIVNVAGESVEDYVALARRLDGVDVAAIEANVSCPNVADGMVFGTSAEAASELVSAVRKATGRFLIVKLTPNVNDIARVARAAEGAGADCLSLINTVSAMAVDWRLRRPRIDNVTGGLSGPAIKPIAVSIPVIGIGGIASADDVLEYFVCGASAVQVGSANFVNAGVMTEIIDELPALLESAGIADIKELIGTIRA